MKSIFLTLPHLFCNASYTEQFRNASGLEKVTPFPVAVCHLFGFGLQSDSKWPLRFDAPQPEHPPKLEVLGECIPVLLPKRSGHG